MDKELCDCRVIHVEKVKEARENSLKSFEVEGLSRIFKAMADPSRIRVLHALGTIEMCVCDLAALLEISESAVSHQLRLLRNMDLVSNRREGNILYYRLQDNHVTELMKVALEHLYEGKEQFVAV